MECFVCGGVAEGAPTPGDYVAISCSNGCGRYRISRSTQQLLEGPGPRLRKDAMQAWLDEQRSIGDANPMISTDTAIWA